MLLLLSTPDGTAPPAEAVTASPTLFGALLSGVVLNQDQLPETNVDGPSAPDPDNPDLPPAPTADLLTGTVYQDFYLPSDFVRGTDSHAVIPDLTGFHVCAKVTNANAASLTWTFEHYQFGSGWETLTSGTLNGADFTGDKVWLEVYFKEPIKVPADWLNESFRFKVTSISGIGGFWYSVPSPIKTYANNGTTAFTDTGRRVSLLFRIMGATADSGTDFLGNLYRSVVRKSGVDNASTFTGTEDAFWLSAPQPSRFAVVNTYFDWAGESRVIDRLLVDPITPGVFFNVYYSNDGAPATSDAGWDGKLWTRVHKTFQALRRETHALPQPITAKYVKIEFTHLQARHYSPGNFQQEITYRKHPKWVLDYFLLRLQSKLSLGEDLFVPRAVDVEFDALDLAYNYYLDDLRQEPDEPIQAPTGFEANSFLKITDLGASVDQFTLSQIRYSFDQFKTNPTFFAKLNYLPSIYTRDTAAPLYPVEADTPRFEREAFVSTLNRDAVVYEQAWPVMFFFVTCRHAYRVLRAPLTHDRAYFVGVREIQFERDNYTKAYDQSLYIEDVGDTVNVERNDFENVNFTWRVYDT